LILDVENFVRLKTVRQEDGVYGKWQIKALRTFRKLGKNIWCSKMYKREEKLEAMTSKQ